MKSALAKDRQGAAARLDRGVLAAIDRAIQTRGEMAGLIVILSSSTGASVVASRPTACCTALRARFSALQQLVRVGANKGLFGKSRTC